MTVLRHSRTVLVTGVVGVLLFGTFALSSLLHPDAISGCAGRPVTPGEALAVSGGFVAFTIGGVYLIASFFLDRHQLSRDGIASRNVLGGWNRITWRDLQSVKYCQYPKAWFRLETGLGSVVRISFALNDLPAFAELVLKHVPHAAMDTTTLTVLRAVASGYAPPMRLA